MIKRPEAYSSEQISEIPQYVQLFVFCVQTVLKMTAPLTHPQFSSVQFSRSAAAAKSLQSCPAL